MANLERGPETLPFIGMGGSSLSVTRVRSVIQRKSTEEPKESQKKSIEEPKESELTKEGDVNLYPNDLLIGTTPERL